MLNWVGGGWGEDTCPPTNIFINLLSILTKIERHQCYDEPAVMTSKRKRVVSRSNEGHKTSNNCNCIAFVML